MPREYAVRLFERGCRGSVAPVPSADLIVNEDARRMSSESTNLNPEMTPAPEPTTTDVSNTETGRRVTLNPTGTAEFKAVGSVDPAKMERNFDAEAEREARPIRETRHVEPVSIEVPQEEDLDAALEAEINAAMGGSGAPATGAVVEVTNVKDLPAEDTLEQGKRLRGRIADAHGENLFVDLGYRSQGMLPKKQFEGKELPAIGTELDVVVHRVSPEEGLIHVSLPTGRQKVSGNWDDVQAGQFVDCMVTKSNKGGLEVMVSSLRGFMPSGQVDLRFVENLEQFVGQKMTVKIIEANRAKKNLVVSRRAVLEEERRAESEKILAILEVGQTLDGVVTSVKDYGAFVNLGGVDGFVHIGQMSWQHIKHPKEVVAEGQAVKAKVISISEDKKKIGLSLKALSQSPWDLAANNYAQGQTVSGTVTRVTEFGAFVQLEPGIEGMVHISELDHRRIARVTDAVSVGQTLDLQVRDVDTTKRRIGLSLKALKAKPEAPKSETSEEPEVQEAPRPRHNLNLKGGKEGASRSGGLFGNPSDFQ